MKKQVKGFGQFVNENRMDRSYSDRQNGSVSLVDLLDCYVSENYANDTVLVMVETTSQCQDLVAGGIMIKVDPTEREIGDAQYDGNYHAELYQNGKRSIEGEASEINKYTGYDGDDDGQFGEYYQQ